MGPSTTSLRSIAGAAVVAAVISTPASAGDFVGLDHVTSDVYDIDSRAGTATNLGPLGGTPLASFGPMARSADGTLYVTGPRLPSGYDLLRIDEPAKAAVHLYTISTSATGDVGLAVDPSGTSIWVAGFIGLSLNVGIQRIDLATGAVSERGTLGGNCRGLAFDGAGDLFTTVLGIDGPWLVKIDKTDAAVSIPVGSEMANVEMSAGVDLASDLGSGAITMLSRGSDTLYSLDTKAGVATRLKAVPTAGVVFHIAANNPRDRVEEHGDGRAGAIVPEPTAP